MKLEVLCPAKVNLFLAVGPPDRRGYHPLRTIFQAVGLFDRLEVTISAEPCSPIIDVFGAELPEENTLTKAYRLSREVFDVHVSHIRLEKQIPMQAGLGGGSSDAAGLLRAMAFVKPAPEGELASLASAIGADVPFFLHGGRARGTRYGDRIEPLPDSPAEWVVIVKPEVGCSTPEMFRQLDEKPRNWLDWPEEDVLYNDFERVAPCECLDIIEMLQMHGARDAGLSGSGSAVFGRFESEQIAEKAAENFRDQHWVILTLTRHQSQSVTRRD